MEARDWYSEINNREMLILKAVWEFMRRSPEGKEALSQIQTGAKTTLPIDESPFRSSIFVNLLKNRCDPEKSFNELFEYVLPTRVELLEALISEGFSFKRNEDKEAFKWFINWKIEGIDSAKYDSFKKIRKSWLDLRILKNGLLNNNGYFSFLATEDNIKISNLIGENHCIDKNNLIITINFSKITSLDSLIKEVIKDIRIAYKEYIKKISDIEKIESVQKLNEILCIGDQLFLNKEKDHKIIEKEIRNKIRKLRANEEIKKTISRGKKSYEHYVFKGGWTKLTYP